MAASSRSPEDDGGIVEPRAFSLGELLTAMGAGGEVALQCPFELPAAEASPDPLPCRGYPFKQAS